MTQAQVFSKKKKIRSSKKFFRRSPKKKQKWSSNKFFRRSPVKNAFLNFFQASYKISTIHKKSAVLEPRTAIFEDLRTRGQGQGLQNVSSRPRTSSRTPPLLFKIDQKQQPASCGQNQLIDLPGPFFSFFFLRSLQNPEQHH